MKMVFGAASIALLYYAQSCVDSKVSKLNQSMVAVDPLHEAASLYPQDLTLSNMINHANNDNRLSLDEVDMIKVYLKQTYGDNWGSQDNRNGKKNANRRTSRPAP
ncbi:MAG: hypothetical protein V3T17_19390 [Pseudomonadales bacterium]